jgi:hypothetical protein
MVYVVVTGFLTPLCACLSAVLQALLMLELLLGDCRQARHRMAPPTGLRHHTVSVCAA